MKYIALATILLLLFISCEKKLTTSAKSEFMTNLKLSLEDSLLRTDLENLNWSLPTRTTYDQGQSFLLKVAFKGKLATEDFVLLHTDKNGRAIEGKIIHLVKYQQSTTLYNGHIQISTLRRENVITSEIVDGSIISLHPASSQRSSQRSLSVPETNQPDVVVTYYINSGSSYQSGTYMWVQTFMSSTGGGYIQPGGISGWYFPLDSPGGNAGAGINNGPGSIGGNPGAGVSGGNDENVQEPVIDQEPILIDFEYSESNEAIDIGKYLKCFSNISDAGATCSIEIFTDIPVDKNPQTFFDWSSASPGHSFIQIKKVNGVQSACQNIGFYPKTGWKSLLAPGSVDSKVVNNEEHEFNASLLMDLTPLQLQVVISQIRSASVKSYDLRGNNCTDFALEVFNSVRSGNMLQIPKYDVMPTIGTPILSNSPQGLYQKLKSMKSSNNAEAEKITIPGLKGYVGSSTGPCN